MSPESLGFNLDSTWSRLQHLHSLPRPHWAAHRPLPLRLTPGARAFGSISALPLAGTPEDTGQAPCLLGKPRPEEAALFCSLFL